MKTLKNSSPLCFLMKGMLLLSGGIDSPVAGFLLKEKNVKLLAVHFSYEPFTDNHAELKSKKAAELLGIKKFFVVRAGASFAKLADQCDHSLYFVLSKRLMYKLAEKLALQEACDFLITGESLAQVSSQVLSNLKNIDQAVSLPVLRPVLCMDKVEIIDLARKYDTFEISSGPEVCDVLGPKHPATKSKTQQVLFEEKKLDPSFVNEAFEKVELVEV